MIKFSASLISSDFLNLQSSIRKIKESKCDSLHLDVADGYFTPNFTFGTHLLEAIKTIEHPPLDIHLMVQKPESIIPIFLPYKPAMISFHHESDAFFHSVYSLLKKNRVKVGLAIKPETPVESVKPYLPMIDVLHIMAVEPGETGQLFLEKSLKKIATANDFRTREKLQFAIKVEGGIQLDSGKRCIRSGANIIVSGTSFFKSESPSDFVSKMKGK